MKRGLLLSLAWLSAVAGVYLAFLLLDVYWNVLNWIPRLDWPTWILFGWIGAAEALIWILARATRDRVSLSVSFVACLALVIAATVALPIEPRSEGLLGRDNPSPLWYRAGRLLLMTSPMVIWILRCRRRDPEC